MDVRNYSDNCKSCDALCCRIFEVQNIRGIQIKSIWDSVCKYLECNNCSVYDSRNDRGLDVCIEHSCLWVWPIITKWIDVTKIRTIIQNVSDQNKLLAKIFKLARNWVMDTLEIDDTRKINSIDGKIHTWVLHTIEKMLLLIDPKNTTEEIQEIFNNNFRKPKI